MIESKFQLISLLLQIKIFKGLYSIDIAHNIQIEFSKLLMIIIFINHLWINLNTELKENDTR